MNKKGEGAILIPIALIVFLASVVLITLIFFVIPGKQEGIVPDKQEITSDITKADLYPFTISQISFVKSNFENEKTVELIREFYEKKDSKSKEKLDKAAAIYIKIFDQNCVDMIMMNNLKEVLWQSTLSPGCKEVLSVTKIFNRKSSYGTNLIIPTEKTDENIILSQRSIVLEKET